VFSILDIRAAAIRYPVCGRSDLRQHKVTAHCRRTLFGLANNAAICRHAGWCVASFRPLKARHQASSAASSAASEVALGMKTRHASRCLSEMLVSTGLPVGGDECLGRPLVHGLKLAEFTEYQKVACRNLILQVCACGLDA
jgi:hypothetical protein